MTGMEILKAVATDWKSAAIAGGTIIVLPKLYNKRRGKIIFKAVDGVVESVTSGAAKVVPDSK